MKPYLSFLFFCLCVLCPFNHLLSQAPNYLWTKGFGGGHDDMGKSIAIDASGNTVITGGFKSSSIAFGSDTLTNSGSTGSQDFFITKIDALGNVLWTTQALGIGDDDGKGVTIDNLGNITVVGSFTSASIVFVNDTLTSLGGTNAFIAHYDSSGNELWAKAFSGSYQMQGYAVCNDALGNIFFAGSYRGAAVSFDTLILSSSPANDNAFLLKIDSFGNLLWGRSVGGSSADDGTGVSCDTAGNVFLAGSFDSDTIIVGSDILYQSGSGPSWYSDVFIIKYDTSGTPTWSRSAASSSTEFFANVSCDASGNAFLSGMFYGDTITSGTSSVVNPYGGSTAAATSDIFIFKYNPLGNVLWGKDLGGAANEVVYGSTGVDSFGDFYIGVSFASTSITVGGTTINNVGSPGTYDVFVTKCTPSGAFLWAKSASGPFFEEVYSVAVNPLGRLAFVGGFFKNALFGTSTIYNFDSSTNYTDVFVSYVDNVLSVEEAFSENNVSVYPNPFSISTTIEIKDFQNQNYLLQLFDLSGRELFNTKIVSSKTEIKKGNLSSGMYLYKVCSQGKLATTGKLIIE